MTVATLLTRTIPATFIALIFTGCAPMEWHNPDQAANLDADSLDCTERAQSVYPTHMLRKRVVDSRATRDARKNFKPTTTYDSRRTCTMQYGRRTCTTTQTRSVDSKPPTIYRTKRYDRNRSARVKFQKSCLRSKGWALVKARS